MGIKRGINPWVSTLPRPELVPQFRGSWQAVNYEAADVVTHANSMYVATTNVGPTDVPGNSEYWETIVNGNDIPVVLNDVLASVATANATMTELNQTNVNLLKTRQEFVDFANQMQSLAGVKGLGKAPTIGDVPGIYRFNNQDIYWDGTQVTSTTPVLAQVSQISNASLDALKNKSESHGVQFADGSRWVWKSTGVENGGTVIKASGNGYWHREYAGAVDIRWFGAVPGGPDCTSAIEAATNVSKDVYIPEGTWYLGVLLLKSHVRIRGAGKKSTILKQAYPTARHFVELLDNTVSHSELSSLSLVGMRYTGEEGAKGGCGIYLNKDTVPPNSNFDSSIRLNNLSISEFVLHGIYIGQNTRECLLNDIFVFENGVHGFFNELGSDNRFTFITSYANGLNGIVETGGANFYSNCKAFGNGVVTRSSNWKLVCSRNTFINCESQEARGNGWEISGNGITAIACVSDCSGIDSNEQHGVTTATPGINLLLGYDGGLQNSNLQFLVTDFRNLMNGGGVDTKNVERNIKANTTVSKNTIVINEMTPGREANIIDNYNNQVIINGKDVSHTSLDGYLRVEQGTGNFYINAAEKQINIRALAASFGPSGRAGFLESHITGVRSDPEQALKQVLRALHNVGLITDDTTA